MKEQTLQPVRRFSIFPKSLARTLEGVVKPISKKHGFAEYRILSEWDSVVGADLAGACRPGRLSFPRGKKDGGTLTIEVSGARALELQHMQPQILDRINTYFGHAAVKKLAFLPASAPAKGKEKKKAIAVAPDAAMLAAAEACDEAELKAALLSLGKVLSAPHS